MKAIGILIDLRDNFIYGELHGNIHEAIKELEEIEDRKCINCKFSSVRFNIDCNLINKLDLPENFCCNRWTQK